MKEKQRDMRITYSALTFLAILSQTIAAERVSANLPANHKSSDSIDEGNFKPSVNNTLLKMEARIDVGDGLDLMQFEDNENLLKPVSQVAHKSGVSYVTAISAPRISASNPSSSQTSPSAERRSQQLTAIEKKSTPVSAVLPEIRGLRTTKISGKDSYLDALEHSHTSKDQKEGIVHSDVRPKVPKIFRRDYHEGPVYRPLDSDRYNPPSTNPASAYGAPSYEGPTAPAPTQPTFFPTPSNSFSLPEQSSFESFSPSTGYGTPQSGYESPQPTYGTPKPSYGIPQQSYGPPQIPQSNYGPPSPAYGVPHTQNVYGMTAAGGYAPLQGPQQGETRGYGPPSPYALPGLPSLPTLPMIDFTWPFALKLNAFTIAKILLKLVIFKMIVKFIAVICLLLFIPKLEIGKKDSEKNDDDEEGRAFQPSSGATDRLNFLTSMVTKAIEKQRGRNLKTGAPKDECDSFVCRLRDALTSGESWSDYFRLFKSFAVEEMQKISADQSAEREMKNS
ncbi:uncharacterized protein LOC105684158 isoform X1 [Athalia rosae]|uniref:uncharacterized protein LOC105684158 isoform X1 n=1 Tax=Athalia rosae TaxID=37344 RepID=UPI0020349A09|nr:uncharacterized protein LOC105684158 isoform X1 [Athalia rosae]XP_048515950.1 uncharacterized protein LOC105684158 isoform X1 [Athalia rosae]XP_048515951.1 uncharacterized protein LOC105684158 isoform X1 [Athalia rosae]